MLISFIEQKGDAWHQWRSDKGMASEAACIMGDSPWEPQTPLQLFNRKKNKTQNEVTPAMQWGTVHEPEARQCFNETYGKNAQPNTVENIIDGVSLGCSLDGLLEEEDVIIPLEIKCPYKRRDSNLWKALVNSRETVDSDELPLNYFRQAQHIMLVTQTPAMHFFVWTPEACILRTVLEDAEKQKRLLDAWRPFLINLSENTPPKLSEKDKVEKTDKSWCDLTDELKFNDRELKLLKNRNDEIKKLLIEKSNGFTSFGNGVTVSVNRNAKKTSIPEEVRNRYTFAVKEPKFTVTIKRS